MAIRRRRTRRPDRPRGEKHGWLWFDRYELIHREVLAAHPFVIADRTRFVPVADRADRMRCRGHIVCRGGIEVDKRLAVRSVNNRTQVRAFKYRYHARIADPKFGRSGRNALR